MLDGRQETVLVVLAASGDLLGRFKVPAVPHYALVENGKVVASGMPNTHDPSWRSLIQRWEGRDVA